MGKNNDLRDCSTLIEALGKEDKEFLSVLSKDPRVFIGIRDDRIIIYHYCAKMYEISKDSNDNRITWKVVDWMKRYNLKDDVVNVNYIKKNHEKYLKAAEKEYCNDSPCSSKAHKEQICQQWIVDKNNHTSKSNYYYLDMEYNTQSCRLGRFDLIAISKKKNKKGKHEVYLIELKVGTGSLLGGNWTIKKPKESEEKYKRRCAKYDKIKLNEKGLYDDGAPDYKDVAKYGAGIVSHIVDFLRFLMHMDISYAKLKENICRIIKCQKDLGYSIDIDAEICLEDIADKPHIAIVCFTHVPDDAYKGNNLKTNDHLKTEDLKTEIKNCLYKGLPKYSGRNLEETIHPAVIEGFMKYKKEPFDDVTCIIQEVNGEPYNYNFLFVDAEEKNCWNYLEYLE